MSDIDSLEDYRTKRDFNFTPEPFGVQTVPSGKPRFVIQKHAASTLHYDLRLEVEGVLKSWAIPKGPSTDPRQKRLAIPTEDHPLDYIDFEGIIPKGAYGAGTVLVWDTGTYENINEKDGETISMAQAIRNGNVKFSLNGKKIKQGFALVRTNKASNNRWLLIKMNDEGVNINQDIVTTEPQSVLSGRTLEEITDKKKI